MTRTRKRYSLDFKKQMVRELINRTESYEQIERRTGVDKACLSRWERKYTPEVKSELESLKKAENEASEELKKLKQENDSLKEECDVLRKAMTILAKGGDS